MVRDCKLDILLIQETKMARSKVEKFHPFKNGNSIGSDSDGTSGGVVIFWNNFSVSCMVLLVEKNIILVKVKHLKEDFSWNLMNIYAPNTKNGKKKFWKRLSTLR